VADVSYAYPLYSLCDYFRCTLYTQVCVVLIFGASYMYHSDCVSWLTYGHMIQVHCCSQDSSRSGLLSSVSCRSPPPRPLTRPVHVGWCDLSGTATYWKTFSCSVLREFFVQLSTSSVEIYERVLLSEIDVSCLSGVWCPEAGRVIVLEACVAWIYVRMCVVPSWDRSSHWWSTSPLTAWSRLAVLPSLFYSSEQRCRHR